MNTLINHHKPTAQGAVQENRGEKLMSIQDLDLLQTREDGKTYHTTIGTRKEDAQKQRELMYAEQARKAKWAKWRKKWMPRIITGIKIAGIMAIAGYFLYLLFWVIVGAVVLMAVGSGMSEAGQEGQARANYYNKVNRDHYNQNYWRH